MPCVRFRLLLRALLILVMSMTGLGQGFAAKRNHAGGIEIVPGLVAPICHDGPAGTSDPSGDGRSGAHHCCDACVLLAPVILSGSPGLTEPSAVVHVAIHANAIAWAPRLARARSPRQAQGPPVA